MLRSTWLVILTFIAPVFASATAQVPPDAPDPQISVQEKRAVVEPCPSGPAPDLHFSPPGLATVKPVPNPCPPLRVNWYLRFLKGPQGDPLTPRQKEWLAARNVADPYEIVTILGDSALATAINSHSAYGPGMPGFARNVGVSFTEEMTGEFIDTFAICSLAHQDPHYHRDPNASIPRRVAHAMFQVVWTKSDHDKPMLNFANLVGFGINDEIANIYVPGRETNARASAERYGIALVTSPIGNLVAEFLPSIASHIHIRVIMIQRIINQVAKTNPGDMQ